jgi:hypothetical protein
VSESNITSRPERIEERVGQVLEEGDLMLWFESPK